MIEFTCVECTWRIHDAIAQTIPEPALCRTCAWIREMPEDEQAELHTHMDRQGIRAS